VKAGEVLWHRQETCHYLGGGVYIVVRPAWAGRWLVEEQTGFGSKILATVDTRSEADALASMEAALRPLYTGEAAA
jgi:hypothetical protein